ncbi:sugar transporter SWEET1-like [Oscarella lobularis]|uniref:sugar transporter SWEET1-like n=1 Tax=Oscarella lobularis TaxID=121494 RepID=UPI0033138A8F
MDFLNFVSWLCILITFGFYCSGFSTCQQFRANKSTGDVPILPFLATAINAALWISYGTLKEDRTLILINTFGLLLQLVYIAVYFIYTANRSFARNRILMAGFVGCSLLTYARYVNSVSRESAIFQMGFTCNVMCVLMFASPLSTVALVIRTKSTKSMSFLLSLATTAMGGCWFLYGTLVGDPFVQIPNALGTILGGVQLLLFARYGLRSEPTSLPL